MSHMPLELRNITKRFGDFTAVNSLSLDVPQGSIIGFLGPNGAGKSTSLRIALGIIPPDEGSVRLFGAKPDIAGLRQVGFLPEERGLYKKMTARGTIAHFARLKGLGAKEAYARADELLDMMGLGEFRSRRVSKLSKGMAQKVQILSTLAHRPEFLILDEPFSGLDPVNQQGLEDIIREEHKKGVTLLFSTHVMEHAERLCDRIFMLAEGKTVFDGTLKEAFTVLGKGARLAVEEGFDLSGALKATGFTAHKDPTDESGHWWRVELPKETEAQDALRAAIEAGAPITGFAPEEARLRDVFVALAADASAEALNDSRDKLEAK